MLLHYFRTMEHGGIRLPQVCVQFIDNQEVPTLTVGSTIGVGFLNNHIVICALNKIELPLFQVPILHDFRIDIPFDIRRFYALGDGDIVEIAMTMYEDKQVLTVMPSYLVGEGQRPPRLDTLTKEQLQQGADFHTVESLISSKRSVWHEERAEYFLDALAELVHTGELSVDTVNELKARGDISKNTAAGPEWGEAGND